MLTLHGAPIRWGGEVLGRLYVTDKGDGQVFSDDDEVAVKAMADAGRHGDELRPGLRGGTQGQTLAGGGR